MPTWGEQFVRSIQDGSVKTPPPPYLAHLKLDTLQVIEMVEKGRLKTRWTVGPEFTMGDGYVQGGLLCTVADRDQTLVLLSTHETFETWPTLDFHTRFVRPIRQGDIVLVESIVLSKTKSTAIIETSFTTPDGKLYARVTGGWIRSARERDLNPDSVSQKS